MAKQITEHYWILGQNREQVIAFAKANSIKPKDYTYIFHPHQFRRFNGKVLIVLREVFTKDKFDPIRIELIPLKKKNTVIQVWSTEQIDKESIWQKKQ